MASAYTPAKAKDATADLPPRLSGAGVRRVQVCRREKDAPKCRHYHRLKQHPRWKVDQLPDGTFRWTTPSGRQYTTEPTRYPI